MTELCERGAVELRRMIGAKDISPCELLESCILRTEAVDGAVNAMVARDFERARKTAQVAERAVMAEEELGALHGLPIGVKDLDRTAAFLSARDVVTHRFPDGIVLDPSETLGTRLRFVAGGRA